MKLKQFKAILRPLLFFAGIVFIILLIRHIWSDLYTQLSKIQWNGFFLSIIVASLGNLSTSILFRELLHKYGVDVSSTSVHKIFFFAQIAKYIPGKIWTLWYQSILLSKPGAIYALIFANIDMTMLQIGMVTAISGALIFLNINFIFSAITILIGLLFCFFIVKSNHLYMIIEKILLYFSYKINAFEKTAFIKSYLLFVYYIFFGATYLVSNSMMLTSAFQFSVSESLVYTAYLSLAWVISALSFIVPGGMGIRELVFIALIQSFSASASFEVLAMIAVVSRFWVILQEILGVFFAFFWSRFFN